MVAETEDIDLLSSEDRGERHRTNSFLVQILRLRGLPSMASPLAFSYGKI